MTEFRGWIPGPLVPLSNASAASSRMSCASAGLGVVVGRYSFDVRLFHPFPSAGLSRRTPISTKITGDQVPDHGRSALRALELSLIVLDGG
jgi:hypothetical protein